MIQETKNEKWCVVSAFGRTVVYPTNENGRKIFCSIERQILPEADIKFRETYEYIVKLHNDRLRFKQKQRAKKNREDGYVKTNPIKESYIRCDLFVKNNQRALINFGIFVKKTFPVSAK